MLLLVSVVIIIIIIIINAYQLLRGWDLVEGGTVYTEILRTNYSLYFFILIVLSPLILRFEALAVNTSALWQCSVFLLEPSSSAAVHTVEPRTYLC